MLTCEREARILVVDRRTDAAAAPPFGRASHIVPCLEGALAGSAHAEPTALFVHVPEPAGERRAAVTAAAELGRKLGTAPVLYGKATPVRELALLCELGVPARFVPEEALAERSTRLGAAVASESGLRRALHEALEALRPARVPPPHRSALWPASAELETRLITAALQRARTVARAAPLLSTSASRLQVRARKLGIRLRDLPAAPARSQRERIVIIGEEGLAAAVAKALGHADLGVACLPPGVLHARGEADSGTIAAVVHVCRRSPDAA